MTKSQFPHVHTLNGQFWKKVYVPSPFKITRRAAKHIQWIEGRSLAREYARQDVCPGTQGAAATLERLSNPSTRARALTTSPHPTPDLVSVDDSKPRQRAPVTNHLAFYFTQDAWRSTSLGKSYEGDPGLPIAKRYAALWQAKLRQAVVFSAWVVERHSPSMQTGAREKTGEILKRMDPLHPKPGLQILVRSGAHPGKAAKHTIRAKAAKIELLQLIRPDVETVHDKRSISLAICKLV